jgi:hypothetical protein
MKAKLEAKPRARQFLERESWRKMVPVGLSREHGLEWLRARKSKAQLAALLSRTERQALAAVDRQRELTDQLDLSIALEHNAIVNNDGAELKRILQERQSAGLNFAAIDAAAELADRLLAALEEDTRAAAPLFKTG